AAGGHVEGQGPGHAAVEVRYLNRAAFASVLVRHELKGPYPDLPANNFVDEMLIARWKQFGARPADPADDPAFVRRVHLHLLGLPPEPEEARRFLASKDPAKRAKLIDELLTRPEFADYWAGVWSEWLGVSGLPAGEMGRVRFGAWLR